MIARRPAEQPGRPAAADARRHPADRGIAVGDDGLDAGHRRVVDCPQRRSSRASASASSSRRCRSSPSRPCRPSCAPTAPRCSAWCATSAAPSASRSRRSCSCTIPRSCTRRSPRASRRSTACCRPAAPICCGTRPRPQGLAALNAEVTRQASIIAYANDFKLMLFVCLPTALLLPAHAPAGDPRTERWPKGGDPLKLGPVNRGENGTDGFRQTAANVTTASGPPPIPSASRAARPPSP